MANTSKSLKTQQLKKSLLEALEKSLGVVTTACRNVGCDRSTFYDHYKKDPEFKMSVDELKNVALDFAESKLHSQIKDGDTTAIIFFLKTQGKGRGYIERKEIDLNERKNVADLFPDELKDEEQD